MILNASKKILLFDASNIKIVTKIETYFKLYKRKSFAERQGNIESIKL